MLGVEGGPAAGVVAGQGDAAAHGGGGDDAVPGAGDLEHGDDRAHAAGAAVAHEARRLVVPLGVEEIERVLERAAGGVADQKISPRVEIFVPEIDVAIPVPGLAVEREAERLHAERDPIDSRAAEVGEAGGGVEADVDADRPLVEPHLLEDEQP